MLDLLELAGELKQVALKARQFPTIEQAVQAFQGLGASTADTSRPA